MRRLLPIALLLASACGTEAGIDPVERGAELASSPALSTSGFNQLACTDCHATGPGDERILSGYTLGGAASRPTWWGGQIRDLGEAVDYCLVWFMKGDPLDRESDDGRALHAWLRDLADAGPTEALPLTVVRRIDETPARGDVERGAEVHRLACASCHGAAGTGAGRIDAAPVLPAQARAEAIELFPDVDPALVFTEKVRHGQFFGIGGNMPLYSLEALSDEDLGALLAFYGL